MGMQGIDRSYLHSAIAVVLGIMRTSDYKVNWPVYIKFLRGNGTDPKKSLGWFQLMKQCDDEWTFRRGGMSEVRLNAIRGCDLLRIEFTYSVVYMELES